jgi:predicted glycosyltransferase
MRRFLFYSHDGLGLGHVRRNLAIASALTEIASDATILVLTAASDAQRLALPPRVNLVNLPGPHRADQRVLAAAVELFRPEVVLVDHDPFGPGGELGPALELLRASGGQAVLGLPDVLDDADSVDLEWRNRGLFDRITETFNRVLVYGQPDLLDPVHEYRFPEPLARITSYCGYVVSPADKFGGTAFDRTVRPYAARPCVLATAGDGDAGFAVLEAFVTAAADSSWHATVVAGSHSSQDQLALLRARAAEAGVTYRGFVPGLPSEFGSLDALVCTGGYNTLAEAAAAGVPTVCIPRAEPSEDQLIRARAFESRGLLRVLPRYELDAEVLRAKVDEQLAEGPRTGSAGLDLGGDRRVAHHLFEVALQRPAREAAEVLPLDLSRQLAVAAAS